jgi:hydroxyacylglutathione hydrolase|tara:strand:- start:119 stop:763 length:645 start_codon:yes stop_codon:yes gene_type:complete
MLNIEWTVTGPFQENSYIVWKENTESCIIIDPGDDFENIIKMIDKNSVKPIAIVNTHAHLDHIASVSDLKECYDIPFYLHYNESEVLKNYERDCLVFGIKPAKTPEVNFWFRSGELKIDSFNIGLIETPGHTPGGTCLKFDNHLFTGDTIFSGSIGRTDLPGGDWNILCDSLIRVMKKIPKDQLIYPGHGPSTSLKIEMQKNQFLIPLLDKVYF